ncbi:hypothetical protein BVX97_01855 [bacterium E08(2017)]|nr:hypothetical protein BVX97_01855 [bacterium E08(2017)]
MTAERKLLVVQVAGLGWDLLNKYGSSRWDELRFEPAQSVFPAVTCAVQAAFRTGLMPVDAGMPGNGFYDPKLNKVFFWEQSSSLVQGERIWDDFRARGGKSGMLFWQQSMGEQVDFIMTPAPIHKHHGGMIQDCYSQPKDLYQRVADSMDRTFDLKYYWGPQASCLSSQWIAKATEKVMQMDDAPGFLMTYLPSMDYDLQRYGVSHESSGVALRELFVDLDLLRKAAKDKGYELLVFGDYAIADVTAGPVYLNRVLLEEGYLKTREVKSRLYADLPGSRAFAVCDHEAAQIFIRDEDDSKKVLKLINNVEGVETVQDNIAVAADGSWFAYQWWDDDAMAPEYATHVDIHNKPGFDPCELFTGNFFWQTSLDATRVGGSHGRVGPGREVCWTSTLWNDDVEDLLELSRRVEEYLG